MGQLVNIMESPVRRLTFGEMGDSYPQGKSNALGDDAESKAYRSKFIDDGLTYKDGSLNPFFAETTRTVDGSPTQILNADDNYRIQCSYFECYSVQDLYRFYIEPNIILASNKLQTQIDTIIETFADNSNATSSKRTNGLVSKTQWSDTTTGSPVLFTSGEGYVAKASTGKLGVVKNGNNTSIGSDGAVNVLTAIGGTTNPLGVVKQGDHVTIDSNGRLSANVAGNPTISAPGSKGVVGIKNGGNINISNGIIEVPKASKTVFGVVKIGNNLSINPETGKLDATDTNTTYPAADDSTPNTLGIVKTGYSSNKGDISWKAGVGTIKGFHPDNTGSEFLGNGPLVNGPDLGVYYAGRLDDDPLKPFSLRGNFEIKLGNYELMNCNDDTKNHRLLGLDKDGNWSGAYYHTIVFQVGLGNLYLDPDNNFMNNRRMADFLRNGNKANYDARNYELTYLAINFDGHSTNGYAIRDQLIKNHIGYFDLVFDLSPLLAYNTSFSGTGNSSGEHWTQRGPLGIRFYNIQKLFDANDSQDIVDKTKAGKLITFSCQQITPSGRFDGSVNTRKMEIIPESDGGGSLATTDPVYFVTGNHKKYVTDGNTVTGDSLFIPNGVHKVILRFRPGYHQMRESGGIVAASSLAGVNPPVIEVAKAVHYDCTILLESHSVKLDSIKANP